MYPDTKIMIRALDKKRLKFYNAIFRRHFSGIEPIFTIWGFLESGKELYNPTHFYQKFEIEPKNN